MHIGTLVRVTCHWLSLPKDLILFLDQITYIIMPHTYEATTYTGYWGIGEKKA